MLVRGDAVCVHLWLPGVFDHLELRRVVSVDRKGRVTYLCAWDEEYRRRTPKLSLSANLLDRRPGGPATIVWTVGEYGSRYRDTLLSEYRWWPDKETAIAEILKICADAPEGVL